MVVSRIKLAQSAAALVLLGCALCPIFEIFLNWDSSIFATGRDTESTVAFLLLLVELSFAIARSLALVVATILQRLGIIPVSNPIAARRLIFSQILPASSPPVLSLRV
jgi:hypothetical protein